MSAPDGGETIEEMLKRFDEDNKRDHGTTGGD